MRQSVDHSLGRGRASNSGNNRTAGKEQYYTPSEISTELVNKVKSIIPDFDSRTLIEPAAGTGSFIDAFVKIGAKNIIAVDIDPKRKDVLKADFLSEYELSADLKNAISITNPPFGRNSSLSVPFFNKLADHCEYICFVVPKSWRKWSIQNRLDRRFHLIYDEELHIDYDDENGAPLSLKGGGLKTLFQIWQKKEELRQPVIVDDYEIFARTTPELADVSLTIFGRGCGKYKIDFLRKSNTTQMFLKVLNPVGYDALDNANFAQFFNNVAFVEALSWNEINYSVNEWLKSMNKLPSKKRVSQR